MTNKKIFLDVGGHHGETLEEVLKPDYRFDAVHCFEPQARCYAHITDKFKTDIAAGRLTVHNFGLADFDGARDLFGGESTSEGASLFADKKDVDANESETCNFKRAGDFIAEHIAEGDLAVMKLNCEGGEVLILRDLMRSGFFRRLANVMIDFDVRKIPSQQHEQGNLINEMSAAGFNNYTLQRQAMVGKTHQDRIRFWLTSLPNAPAFLELTDREKTMRRLPPALRWFIQKILKIDTVR